MDVQYQVRHRLCTVFPRISARALISDVSEKYARLFEEGRLIETGGTLKLVIPLTELENGLVVPGKEVYGIYQERRQ